jgi:hypothetical protein
VLHYAAMGGYQDVAALALDRAPQLLESKIYNFFSYQVSIV